MSIHEFGSAVSVFSLCLDQISESEDVTSPGVRSPETLPSSQPEKSLVTLENQSTREGRSRICEAHRTTRYSAEENILFCVVIMITVLLLLL